MTIIVFHRNQPKKAYDESKNGNAPVESSDRIEIESNKRARESKQGLSEFKYALLDKGKSLILTVEAKGNGQQDVKGTVAVRLNEWTQQDIYYRPNTQKIEVIDGLAINPVSLSQTNFIGRIITTDTETLVYLRGRIPNISGFKNIVVADDQTSATAFAKYSSKVKHFMEETDRRRHALSKVDVFKQLNYLETQVDVLTKVILAANIIKDPAVKAVMQEALKYSPCLGTAPETLKKRVQYKKEIQALKNYC